MFESNFELTEINLKYIYIFFKEPPPKKKIC